MQIKYTKEGMKITHSTGIVQTLSVEDLTRLKNSQIQRTPKITALVTFIDTQITELQKIVR